MKCGAWEVRLLLPLLAQKLSIPSRGMELQGAQILEVEVGILEFFLVAGTVVSTQARPQRVDASTKEDITMPDMVVVTLATFQLARSLLKDVAPSNVLTILVTLSTFHLLKSLVKDLAYQNV